MHTQRTGPLAVLALLLASAAWAQDDRVYKISTTIEGRPGHTLSKLVIHEGSLRSKHEECERKVLELEGQEAEATARTDYDAWLDAASKLDLELRARREIEAEYFDLVTGLLPPRPADPDGAAVQALDPKLRGEIVSALQRRLLDAWTAREGAVDAFMEATVRAEGEGWPGTAALLRGVQSGLTVTPGGGILKEIEAAERERTDLVAAIEEVERALQRIGEERRKLEESRPADDAQHQVQLEYLQKSMSEQMALLQGTPEKPGLKVRKSMLEEKIAGLRRDYEGVRRDSLATASTEHAGGEGARSLLAWGVSSYGKLAFARRTLARTTIEVEHLVSLIQTLAAARRERAIVARRLAVRDPDVLEGLLHDEKSTAALEDMNRAGDELRDSTIDCGVASLVRRSLATEDSLLAQNEYFNALGTLLRKKQLVASNGWTRASQASGNFLRGVMDLGMGAWDGFFDGIKQTVNRPLAWTGLQWRTKSRNTIGAIAKERRKYRDQVGVLEQARTMTAAGMFNFFDLPIKSTVPLAGTWTPTGKEGDALKLLRHDSSFLDSTNGGLRRIAASYDTTLFERLESEYLIACERAELTLESLERARLRNLGLDEETKRVTPGIFLSPGRIAASVSFWASHKNTELAAHIGMRKAQHEEMLQMLEVWRELRFDPAASGKKEPDALIEVYKRHLALLNQPDYARFWDMARAERSAAQEDLLVVLAAESKARGDWVDQRAHAARLDVLRAVPAMPQMLARALVEDAADLAYQGDFAGTYACLVQANALDWNVVSAQGLRTVENELASMESREIWIANLTQVADTSFYAALTAFCFPPTGVPTGSVLTGMKKALTTTAGWKGLCTFAAQQVSPFAMVLNKNTLLGGEIKVSMFVLSRAVGEGLAREALRDGCFCSFMDPEVADFIAAFLVDGASWKAQRAFEKSFLGRAAKELKDLNDQLKERKRYQDVLDYVEADYAKAIARKKLAGMTDLWTLESRVAGLKAEIMFWQKSGVVVNEAKAKKSIALVVDSEQTIAALRSPVTIKRVQSVLMGLQRRLDSQDPKVRHQAEVDLFRRLEFADLARLKPRLELMLGAETVRRIDEARRNIVQHANDHFLQVLQDPVARLRDPAMRKLASKLTPEQRAAMKKNVIAMLYTGSGGKPQGNEYKPLKSDLDLTVLVKDLDQPTRDFMKKLVDHCFTESTEVGAFKGFKPEHFELNYMVDALDLLAPTGWKAAGPGAIIDQVLAECALREQAGVGGGQKFLKEVIGQLEGDLTALRANIHDPEKYVITGRLRAISYLAGISGVVCVPDPATGKFIPQHEATGPLRTLADQLSARAFESARMERWMSLDIMLDDLGFLRKAEKKYGALDKMDQNTLFEFTDKLDKYGIRVLLGGLAGTPEGLDALNGLLTRPGGGDHGDFCDIAIRLSERLNLTDGDRMVIAEWKARKHNRRIPEILAERLKGANPPPDDPGFKQALRDHVNGSISLVEKLVGLGLETGCKEIAKLNDDIARARAEKAPNSEYLARICELKRDRILLSYAAAYDKLPAVEKEFMSGALKKAGLDIDLFAQEVAAAKHPATFNPNEIRYVHKFLEERKRREDERRNAPKDGK